METEDKIEEPSKLPESDIDDNTDDSYYMSLLTPRADNTAIINKLNELINSFNKSLRDYKI